MLSNTHARCCTAEEVCDAGGRVVVPCYKIHMHRAALLKRRAMLEAEWWSPAIKYTCTVLHC